MDIGHQIDALLLPPMARWRALGLLAVVVETGHARMNSYQFANLPTRKGQRPSGLEFWTAPSPVERAAELLEAICSSALQVVDAGDGLELGAVFEHHLAHHVHL